MYRFPAQQWRWRVSRWQEKEGEKKEKERTERKSCVHVRKYGIEEGAHAFARFTFTTHGRGREEERKKKSIPRRKSVPTASLSWRVRASKNRKSRPRPRPRYPPRASSLLSLLARRPVQTLRDNGRYRSHRFPPAPLNRNIYDSDIPALPLSFPRVPIGR